jgi:hypothetical protein
MQGREDVTALLQSFTGSHRYVLDYLVEEVLEQQPAAMQDFVLQTSVLEMLTGALCNALTGRNDGQATLERLEHGNLFIVPLDEERRWYRYHHLFADLLRQRLRESAASPTSTAMPGIDELHIRASAWYEANGLPMHAFHHAAAAGDVERVARLMEGEKLPVHHRTIVTPILTWLDSLPKATLDAHPSLRIECHLSLYNVPAVFTKDVPVVCGNHVPGVFTNSVPAVFTNHVPAVFGRHVPGHTGGIPVPQVSFRDHPISLGRNHVRQEKENHGHPRIVASYPGSFEQPANRA